MSESGLDAELCARLSEKLEREIGLQYGPAQWPELERGVRALADYFACHDARSCANWLLGRRLTPSEQQAVARQLAIGETYFFRDPACFHNLEQVILPGLLAARRAAGRRLRIWSAACSTGEEAYSVAMLLAAMLPDWREWDISILATDINAQALAKAKMGVYGKWSLRSGVPAQCRDFLLDAGEGRHEVDPSIRAMVRFASVNLAQDDYPCGANGTQAVDLVLCRNVLIYFEAGRAGTVLTQLGRSLSADGWLLTSAVEVPLADVVGLARVELPGMIALRRHLPFVKPAALVQSLAIAARPAATRPVHPKPAPAKPAPAKAVRFPPVPQPAGASAPATADLAALARLHADKGDLTEAAQLCELAIGADKQNAELAYLMAVIRMEQGATAQARAALRRTLYLCPSHVMAQFALGSLAASQGRITGGERNPLDAQT